MVPNGVYNLIPKNCDYVSFHDEEEWRLLMELGLLIIWFWDEEINLDYAVGPM